TVYRAMISRAWPDTLLGMTPGFWQTYFDAVGVEVERDGHERRGRIIVSGLGGIAFMAPVAEGWLTRAYEWVGTREIEVIEQSWREGRDASDRLVFSVRWA